MRLLWLSIDGTKADWPRDGKSFTTAIQGLYRRWPLGWPRDYIGGPGTDDRLLITRVLETLLGTNLRARREILREKMQAELGLVDGVVLAGWSRGGAEVYNACETAREVGMPVKALLLFDPVPARWWTAVVRVIPWFPILRSVPRPANADVVIQILAGEEHSRLLRHVVVEHDPKRDPVPHYLPGNHRYAQSVNGEAYAIAQLRALGVPW